MRAFATDEFGAPGSVRELPDPQPGEGQVRVRVEAASVNPADNYILGGAYKDYMPHHFPLIGGIDLAGTVDAVGPGVTDFAVGDRVFGGHGKPFQGEGTFAEQAVATTGSIARLPAGVDAPFGAAISLAGASAIQTFDTAHLKPGDVVLVLGASGGIGSIVVQLAEQAGAHVIATCRTQNHDYVRSLGADETICYASQDVFATVKASHPDGIAGIFDLVGDRDANARLAEQVRPGGFLVSMMNGADAEALAARGLTGTNIMTATTTDKLDRLGALAAGGALRRPEIRTVPLAETGAALAEIGGRHVRGKLVVTPQA